MNIILTGTQIEAFQQALMAAFPSYAAQKKMLRFQLNKRLAVISAQDALGDVTLRVIEAAEAEGWLYDLLQGARKQNPGNPQLLAFEQSISLATRGLYKDQVEAKIKPLDEFFSLNDWLPKLQQIEKQVCRVEIDKEDNGTGFLVAPDIVLTAYHVVETVIKGTKQASDIGLRFDFKQLHPDRTDMEGTVYHLATDWLVAYDTDNTESNLDYALLRLAHRPTERGFVALPTRTDQFVGNYRKNGPVFIVQHPDGKPLKLALDTESIIGLNDYETRLYYRAITEGGSSGSPCFNAHWELIAMHRSGAEGIRNGGVPITALLKAWEAKDLDWTDNFVKRG